MPSNLSLLEINTFSTSQSSHTYSTTQDNNRRKYLIDHDHFNYVKGKTQAYQRHGSKDWLAKNPWNVTYVMMWHFSTDTNVNVHNLSHTRVWFLPVRKIHASNAGEHLYRYTEARDGGSATNSNTLTHCCNLSILIWCHKLCQSVQLGVAQHVLIHELQPQITWP